MFALSVNDRHGIAFAGEADEASVLEAESFSLQFSMQAVGDVKGKIEAKVSRTPGGGKGSEEERRSLLEKHEAKKNKNQECGSFTWDELLTDVMRQYGWGIRL